MALTTGRQPRVTVTVISINLLIWLAQVIPGSTVTTSLFYAPLLTITEPWRMLTAGFVHSPDGPWHILINAYSIYIFGRILEPMLGSSRFLALYLISIFGGSAAVLWLSDPLQPVVGASGAFFGLMGAYFILLRAIGDKSNQLVGLIAINLAFGFFVPGISWEGHLGGLIAGILVTIVYTRIRNDQPLKQKLGVLLVGLLIAAVSGLGVILKIAPILF